MRFASGSLRSAGWNWNCRRAGKGACHRDYAEVLTGIALMPPGKRQRRLTELAIAMFTDDFAGRILAFDRAAAPAYAAIVSMRRLAGSEISPIDGMIAAIAQIHGATIASRDSDFAGCGVLIIDPWQA